MDSELCLAAMIIAHLFNFATAISGHPLHGFSFDTDLMTLFMPLTVNPQHTTMTVVFFKIEIGPNKLGVG